MKHITTTTTQATNPWPQVITETNAQGYLLAPMDTQASDNTTNNTQNILMETRELLLELQANAKKIKSIVDSIQELIPRINQYEVK